MFMNEQEEIQLALYRSMATMNQGQAVEYHELLVKEAKPVVEVVEVDVVEPKKKKGKK